VAFGKKALGIAMNVANEESVEVGVAAAVRAFGVIDILVSTPASRSFIP
jgi:3-hydroxybutyrate dehydrogenase